MAGLRYGEDMDFEERAKALTQNLMMRDEVKEWKHLIKMEILQPQYSVDQVQTLQSLTTVENPLIDAVFQKTGIAAHVKRTVINLHCEAMQATSEALATQTRGKIVDERVLPGTRMTDGCKFDVVRAARNSWERVTSDEMLRVASELGRPLVALKATEETVHHEIVSATESPKAQIVKPSKSVRLLYDGNDLLRSLQAIEPSNQACEQTETPANIWSSIPLQLSTLPFLDYQRVFSELAPGCGQIGLDELFPTQRAAFVAEKDRVGDLVVAHNNRLMARQFSKTGCPVSLRPQIWRQILTVSITAQDRSYYNDLQKQVTQWTYLTDEMYLLDLQQTIDSSDHFVFRDHLESVLMSFTRDTFVLNQAVQVNGYVTCSHLLNAKPLPKFSLEPGKSTSESKVPPNGVLPFRGLAMYIAPLAYLYADPIEIYYVFRELYIRYWSKLNAICTEPGTILPLCKLFEDLVVRSSPAVVFHLLNIGLNPLDIAFPWIHSAFSGVLDIDQVLLLWDRVIGYDSLDLVAILAAALFDFRANELERVNTREDVDDLFTELTDVPVIMLLQDYLFTLS